MPSNLSRRSSITELFPAPSGPRITTFRFSLSLNRKLRLDLRLKHQQAMPHGHRNLLSLLFARSAKISIMNAYERSVTSCADWSALTITYFLLVLTKAR